MRILFLCTVMIFSLIGYAQDTYSLGVTAAPGLPFTENKTAQESVRMKQGIVYFRGFEQTKLDDLHTVALSSFQYLYALENTSTGPMYTPIVIPVYYFFTEFDPVNRSKILDNLAELMPGILQLDQNEAAIKEQLNTTFANRNFIRRIVSARNLDNLHLNLRVWQDDNELKLGKIVLEFRWIKDRETQQEVLAMDAFLHVDVNIKQPGTTILRMNHAVPSYFQHTSKADRYYTPFHLGTGHQWKGNIASLYLVRNVLDATLAFPYYFNGKQHNYGVDKSVMVLEQHEPEASEKIAFLDVEGNTCGCYAGDGQPETLYIPEAITNITASNWWQPQKQEAGRCIETDPEHLTVKWVPDWEHGLSSQLAIATNPLAKAAISQEKIATVLSNDCDVAGDPILKFKSGFHPLFAFDVADDSLFLPTMRTEGHFGVKSAWCVQSDRQGRGESLSFTISQPVRLIKFYTGMHANDALYKRYNRIKHFKLERIGGNFEKILSFSDIVTSSYELDLPPGTYKMTIQDIYDGERPDIACFSAIQMHFHFNDTWFDTYFKQLEQ